jgi:leader peptidase (prepilin peptidase) / N-methyltransferase
MEILVGIIIFVFGLCFGSFVNMLVYRNALRYKLTKSQFLTSNDKKNRRFCDYCGKQLRWYENIPVFSWLILKGKTRCCNKKLPVSYPVVELMMGILFIINFQFLISNDQLNWLAVLLSSIIVVLLVFSAVFDWEYKILPDFSTIILIGCAIGLMLGRHIVLPLQQILSALIAAGFLLILNLITRGKGMGMGDIKFAVFMGLMLGYPNIILAFYVAFIVGAIYGLGLIVFKKANKKSQVPFGPFLILGTIVAWWWGELIIKFLMSNF